MKDQKINIALCWKDETGDYTKFPATTIVSILENNKKNDLRFFLVSEGLQEENKEKLKKIFEKYSRKYVLIDKFDLETKKFAEELYKIKKVPWGIGTYYDLLLSFLLPEKIDEVLYVDTDTLVLGDISKIKEINLGNNLAAGVLDFNYSGKAKLFGLNEYVNAGVLLFNLKEIRKLKRFKEKCLNFSREKLSIRTGGDQDIVNCVFKDRISLLPKEFNYMLNTKNKWRYEDKALILHYTYLKPWISPCFMNRRYVLAFFQYLDKTPWRGWRPNFDLKKGIVKTTAFGIKTSAFFNLFGMKKHVKKIFNYSGKI